MKTDDSAAPPPDAVTIETRAGLKWVVVRTRPRGEKKVAMFCRARSLHHYLPLRRSIRRYPNKVAEFMVPMFSGYLFAHTNSEQRMLLEQTRNAIQIIIPSEESETTLITDLNDVQRLEQASLIGELVVRPEIAPGHQVIVKSGPLGGLSGIVERRKNKTRITVNIDLIGQSLTLEVDVSEVEVEF